VLAIAERGAVLLDSREITDFAAGHLRGAVNIGLQGRFAEWAGDVLPPNRDIVLVGDPASALETKVRLARVGLDRVVGQLEGSTALLAARPELHETSSRLTVEQLAELQSRGPDIQLVDVRNQSETAQGTIVGARQIPLATLAGSLAALDRTAPVVVYCAGGSRSHVASTVLREAGFVDVSDLLGGYAAWEAAGLPVTAGTASGERRPARS
jgi:rhodanese-related sulfurtransferase